MGAHRVIVVGGGGSGVPFAVRLAQHPGIDVLLLEAGHAWRGEHHAPERHALHLRDASTVAAAMPGGELAWTYHTELLPGRDYTIARGMVLGGSTAVNGAYFMRAHPDDFADWAEATGEEWSYPNALPALRRLEHDRDFPADAVHGHDGSVPVVRPAQGDAITRAFVEAAASDLGHPFEPDKNAGGVSGVGALPTNALAGRRWSTASSYLASGEPSSLTIRGGAHVRRVIIRGNRAIGVEFTTAGEFHREYADEVALCAGAVETPRLLMRSGIGSPRDGVPWVVDLPGVGTGLSDHPSVILNWKPVPGASSPRPSASWTAATNFSAPDGSARGDLEILLSVASNSYIVTGIPSTGTTGLRVALQTPISRGKVHPEPASRAISYGYLHDESDRDRLRFGVREGLRLLRSQAFASVVESVNVPEHDLMRDDRFADGWIAQNLGTSLHSSGTARMGVASDQSAVLDSHGRVHGVDGLRVADTSALPHVPSRGTAATAVFLGERFAELRLSESK
jgi:choline dehydrogenase